jgi:cyclohexanecarboxyl-CoA dehydrogenase
VVDYSFTEEQQILRNTVREFAREEMRPWVRFIDEHGHEREGMEKAREVRQKASKLGLTGLGLPSEYGGTPVSAVTHGVIAEEVARSAGSAMIIDIFRGPEALLARYGTEEQKKSLLPPVCAGDTELGIASTEPAAGSDLSAITCTAEKEGDEYVLNGEKQYATGVIARDVFLVLCRTNKEAGHRGMSLFVVDLREPGINRYAFRGLGWHHIDLGGFVLKDVRVPSTALVGEENKGFYMFLQMFDWMRGLAGCCSVGLASGSLEESIEHVKQRQAFGRPVGKFEAVQFRIAEDATVVEAARWLSYRVLWLKDSNLPLSTESSMVKWWVPTVCFNVINNCIQNKGALAYTHQALDELRLREVRAYWIADGTIDIQKMIIGRNLLGKEYDPTK